MKKALKILAVLALLLIVGASISIWWVFRNLDSLAKNEVERAGTATLGVPTRIDSVSIHIWNGNLALSGLDIANPPGFKGKQFLGLKSANADVALGTLREDTVQIPTLTLKGLDVNIEQTSSGANYQQILDNIKKNRGPAPASSGPEKKLVIGDLLIENITIRVDMQGMAGKIGQVVNPNTTITLPIERIELKNVGRTGTGVGGTGVTTSELSSIVVQAVMAAAVEKGQGMIPDIILGDIKNRIGALGDLAQFPVEVIGKAGEAATQLGQKAVEGVGKAIGDVGKTAGDAIKNVGDGIGNLLGGGDKKDDKKKDPKKP
jgi:hypothetical protein